MLHVQPNLIPLLLGARFVCETTSYYPTTRDAIEALLVVVVGSLEWLPQVSKQWGGGREGERTGAGRQQRE